MNLGNSIRSGVKWLLMGSMGMQFLEFCFGVILARLLVPADFGMIVTLQAFTGFVAMLASGGMGQSLIRSKDVTEHDYHAVFSLQLVLGILIYLGFFLAAPSVAVFLNNALYSDLLRASALSLVIRPFNSTKGAWLSREMQFKKQSLIGVAGSIIGGVVSVIMAAGGLGVWALILSGLLGSVVGFALLTFVTPIRLRFSLDIKTVRRHSGYGFKVTAADFLKHIKEQGIVLILSKFGGAAFLGLFNKAESLARMPNRLITPPTSQAVFRAMSKVQDDLDQTKYMFYRTITLLLVYVSPGLVGLWWTAQSMVEVLYGEKWLPVVEPLRIIILSGFIRCIWIPCSLVLGAQNRLTQELIAEVITMILALPAYFLAVKWGLAAVAWALLLIAVFYTIFVYYLVSRVIPTGIAELLRSLSPGMLFGGVLFIALALLDAAAGTLETTAPIIYLAMMICAGASVYACLFLFVPIPAIRSETDRWRRLLNSGWTLMRNRFK